MAALKFMLLLMNVVALNSITLRKQGVYLDMWFLSLSSLHRNFLIKFALETMVKLLWYGDV